MTLLSTSVRVRRRLNFSSSSTRTSSPLTILQNVDSVEVHMAPCDVTADSAIKEVQEKERELIYQQVILEGCKGEMASLKGKLNETTDPEEREELMEQARNFARVLQGKKEQFLALYGQWRSSITDLDHEPLTDTSVVDQPS